jgi:hypothetical protein
MTPPDLHPVRPSPVIEGAWLRLYRRRLVQQIAAELDLDRTRDLIDVRVDVDEAIAMWRDGQW